MFSFLTWSAAGKSMSLVGLLQSSVDRAHPHRARGVGRLPLRTGRRHQHRDRRPAAVRGVRRGDRGQRQPQPLPRAARRGRSRGPPRADPGRVSPSATRSTRSSSGWSSNVLATGLTGYLYDRVLIKVPETTLNSPAVFHRIAVPLLSKIPGPRAGALRTPNHLPVPGLRRPDPDPGRAVPDPLGAAGAGRGRASGGGRDGGHPGPGHSGTTTWCSGASSRASAGPT